MVKSANFEKSAAAANYFVKNILDKIIYVEENASLEEMLQENLSGGRADGWNESDRLISGAFLEWFLHAFPYVYYGLIESPEVTANITEILSNRMYDYSAGSGACRQEIVGIFDKDVYAVDFDVYHEEAFADLCGKLSARKKALEPVAGLLDECRKKLGDKQRFEIGSIVCNFMNVLRMLMHDETIVEIVNELVKFMRIQVAARTVPATQLGCLAEESGMSVGEYLEKIAEEEAWAK